MRPETADIVLKPSEGWAPIDVSTLWKRRSLIYFLVWRDIKVRYKQTLLGAAWVVLQPFSMMVLFSIVFGFLAKLPSEGIPYPVFVFCALLPWQLVANSFSDAGNSLAANQSLITKVYFPRLIIPLSAVLARLVDFVFALAVLVGMLFYYDMRPGGAVWALPIFVVMALAVGLGVGLLISSLGLRYRDVRQMIPFLTQLWFFASPIAYSASLIPENWRGVYVINPMIGIIEGFRWSLLGTGKMSDSALAVSVVTILLMLLAGLFCFRRIERTVADVV